MAQSRMYLKCKECGKQFYLGRLSSAQEPNDVGEYRIQGTHEELDLFFVDHAHLKVNGEQYELYYQ